jgi:hypothetical protein
MAQANVRYGQRTDRHQVAVDRHRRDVCTLASKWSLQRDGGLTRLSIEYGEEIFGPQPFMAVKLLNEAYHHVNFDIVEPFRRFTYVFDDNTVPIDRVQSIVVGTNDRHGNVIVDRIQG